MCVYSFFCVSESLYFNSVWIACFMNIYREVWSFWIPLIPFHSSLSCWNLSHQMPLLCSYLLLISGPMCLAKVCWWSIGCYSVEEVLLISRYTTEENDTPPSTGVNYQHSLRGRGLGSEVSSPSMLKCQRPILRWSLDLSKCSKFLTISFTYKINFDHFHPFCSSS